MSGRRIENTRHTCAAGRPARGPSGAWLAGAFLASVVLAGAVLLGGAMPARAQNAGYYGVTDSNYAVFSSGGGSAPAQRRRTSGGGSWQPGRDAVYPGGDVLDTPAAAPSNSYGGTRRSAATAAIYGSGRSPEPAAPSAGPAPGGDTLYGMGPGSAAATPVYQTRSGRGPDPAFNRQTVPYESRDPAGTIIVDTGARYLYLLQGNGTAIRYGIGVGRDGFAWSGNERVSRKAEWPDWIPPAEMIARRPGLPERMAGGMDNPLGARALYLGNTLYRIHGTNEPDSIGQAVSSGCIRLRNDDVVDLYNRVRVGALVRVI